MIDWIDFIPPATRFMNYIEFSKNIYKIFLII
jgi:hypothetical protein